METIRPGDEVLSRSEHDWSAQAEWKVVEERFERTGCILHLHVGGEVIRTTPEHPFFVQGEGWKQTGGDRIATLSGEWVSVEEVFDTQEWEPVYNLRVADHHTYFVGDEEWGFAAWAHNEYKIVKQKDAEFTDPDTEKKTKRGMKGTISDDVSGYSQTWFVPRGLPASTDAKKEACADNRSNVGRDLQTAVTGFNNDWKGLLANDPNKYSSSQSTAINNWLIELNALRSKYGLPQYDLNAFLMGGNPNQLPGMPQGADPNQYKADCAEYGRLLRLMNSMRASAQGIYIHNKVSDYCQLNGLIYSTTGVDVTAPATTDYVIRHYEVLRDTNGSWQRH